jgi:tetraacyldisaccharide 4'-kinase
MRRAIEAAFLRAWYGPFPQWTLVLLPLMWAFAALLVVRRWHLARQSTGAGQGTGARSGTGPAPVVVIGGITVGGTGKTPVVIALAKALQERGLGVGVVSRGYGRVDPHTLRWVRDDSLAAEVGDEPLLIYRETGCPVVVGAARLAAVRALCARVRVDVVLSDDGLQHYAMPRCFEVGVIDEQRGLGNGYLLPVGPLREPRQRLQTLDWLLWRVGSSPEVSPASNDSNHVAYRLEYFEHAASGRQLSAEAMRSEVARQRGIAVTGLGQPQQFFDFLGPYDLPLSCRALADHEVLSSEELAEMSADFIVVTAKDAVKMPVPPDPRVYVVHVSLALPSALVTAVCQRIEQWHSASPSGATTASST